MKNKYTYLFILFLFFGFNRNATAQTTNTEGFESGLNTPTGWTNSNTGYIFNTTSGSNPTQSPHGGTHEIEFNSYSISSGSANLITPLIDWSCRGGSTPTISFWFYRDVTAYNTATYAAEGVNIYVNTSAAVGGTQLGFVPRAGSQTATGMASGAATSATSQWIQYTFNIPAGFNTSTNYIIFNFVSKDGDNCFMDDVQWISYLGPTVAAIGGGAASVCVGATTPAFTDATAGGTWSITNGTGSATISAGGVVTGVSAGAVTVVYSVTSGGCTGTASYALTVNDVPVVAAIGGGTNPLCVGSTSSAFTDATAGGTWSETDGTGSATINTGTKKITGVSGGVVNVNYAVTNACGTTTVTYPVTIVSSVNDACSGAIALTSGVAVASTNQCATTSTGGVTDPTPSCYSLGVNNTVWYTYTTGASAGTLTLSLAHGTMTYAAISIHSGSCGSFTQVGCSDPNTGVANPSATVCLLANTTYYIMVWDDAGTAGTFTLTPTFVASSALAAIGGGAATVCVAGTTPAFTDATGGGTWSITNGTGSATISAGGVVTGVSTGTATVVYSVGCASTTYTITINTVPTVAAIGGGAASVCVAGTTPAFTDATGGGTWSITNGTGSATISAGGVVTGVSLGTATVNYAVTNTCGTTTVTYPISIQAACSGAPTAGAAEPTVFDGCSSYASTISLSGNVTGVCGLSYQWYSSTDNNTWTSLGAGATSTSYAATISATTYYQCVVTCANSGQSTASSSAYCQMGAASNDACNNAISLGVVTSAGAAIQGDNTCATSNTGGFTDPTACLFYQCVNTIWYSFTTPNYSTSYTITLTDADGANGTLNEGGFGLYSGTCGSLTQVGCGNGTYWSTQTLATACLPANTTYYIEVFTDGNSAGSKGSPGVFNLNIQSPDCGAGNAVASVTEKCSAGSYASTISLSGNTGCASTYQWQSSTNNSTWSNIGGATSSTYAATVSADIYYRCIITCFDGTSSTSTSVYCATPNAAPVNDVPGGAINLTFQAGINSGDYIASIVGNNACATADGTSSCFTANKSVWYTFTAPTSGSYNIMIQGGSSNMIWPELSIKSTSVATEVNCAGITSGTYYSSGGTSTYGYSPFSQISPYYSEAGSCNLTAGQTYYIMVDNYSGTKSGYTGTASNFTLTVATLSNDQEPSGVVVNSCGSVFNSSTIGATNCGNGVGNGSYSNLDNNAATGSSGSGSDVVYSVENDSWYQFCTVATSTVNLNFTPIVSSCLPTAASGGSGGLQISIFTGTPSNLTTVGGSGAISGISAPNPITSGIRFNYVLAANQCCYVEVDGYAGTNCNYQLTVQMTPTCVLPVDILSLNGVLTDDLKVKIDWVTASEANSDHYLVERSTNGVDFITVGTVKAAGNSDIITNYELYDNYPARGINYYKLTEFDKNGVSNFLGYATVSNRASLPLLNLYPNPAQNYITLSLKNFATPLVSYELYDAQGLLIQTENINLVDGNQDYRIDVSSLNKGFYFVKVNTGDELLKKTFIKAE